jgi:signal transduction histidine kinase/tetratricopeptide (TPR) repeat protein
MKIFTQGILARRKIAFIFLLAILLPSLIIGYLSFSTFAQRRESVRRLLESNLWISGESALKSIEDELLEHEKEALKPENFARLTELKETKQALSDYSKLSKEIAGQLFLLNAKYQIIIPKTGKEDISIFPGEKNVQDTEFTQALKQAESLEFSGKNYSRAAELYRKCTSLAPTNQHKALALEALGRCLLSLKKYRDAYKVYSELSAKYGQFLNKAGHPYGILAAFQLYDIEQRRKREENSLKILLSLYEKIRKGAWLVNLSTYDFFIVEIESILNDKFTRGRFPEIRESYLVLQKQQSPYSDLLVFTDFLKREAVPKIKEKLTLSRMGGEVQPGRLLAARREEFCLVSYNILHNFQSEKTFYGGFCWDLSSLKKEIFPRILENLTKDTGLSLQVIDERGQNILTGKEELASKDSLSLSYRQFPFPWKLLVSQPAFSDLERTARRENFLYGVLLTFIVALMLMGAFLIVRDISRESETTRLKTEFVHNISHELKTPLTLIRLYGETLQRKEDLKKDEKKEAYQIITKESERLSHLINNVLDFSRIEMGRKEFDFKKGSLAQIVRDTLESYRYHLERKGFSVQNEIASELPEMNFDGEAVASVLVNLLSNAMKFSPNIKEVTVKLFKDNGNAVLQVADKGIGISPKDISRIFNRFYRVKNETVSEAGGSGLGLTLVKHIAEAHGGRIKVESEPGKGSVFSVIFSLSGPKKG